MVQMEEFESPATCSQSKPSTADLHLDVLAAAAPCTLASLPLIGICAGTDPFKANPFKQHLILTYVVLQIGVAELNHKLISVFAHPLASGDSDGVRSHDL